MTIANNRQKFYALAIYWLRDYSRNFGVETRADLFTREKIKPHTSELTGLIILESPAAIDS
jgi:hypothetical protein